MEPIYRILNVAPDQVNSLQADWIRLMKEGVIVKVMIGRWRGEIKLRLVDLGIDPTKVANNNDLVKLGTLMIAPPQIMAKAQSIEQQARNAIAAAAVNVPGIADGFVFAEGYASLSARLREKEVMYMTLRDEFCGSDARWNAWRNELISAYRTQAAEFYKVASRMGTVLSLEEFVQTYLARISDALPSRLEVYESWTWNVRLTYIPLPDMLAQTMAEAEQIKTDNVLARMRDDVYKSVAEDAQRQAQEFATAILVRMREETAATVDAALESVRKNGYLHARSVTALENWSTLIGQYSRMGDQELAAAKTRIDTIVRTSPAQRDADSVIASLSAIGTMVRDSLSELKNEPRTAPSVANKARIELGLEGRPEDDEFKIEMPVLPIKTTKVERDAIDEAMPAIVNTGKKKASAIVDMGVAL